MLANGYSHTNTFIKKNFFNETKRQIQFLYKTHNLLIKCLIHIYVRPVLVNVYFSIIRVVLGISNKRLSKVYSCSVQITLL